MHALLKLGRRLEDGLLVILLAGMILLASLQIILRNGFDTGFVWADELLRILVLWVAMAGAMVASRVDRHLRIDVLLRLMPIRPRLAVAALVDLFTALVTLAIAWHAWRFVAEAREYEDVLLGGWPAWWFQIILPVGFALIGSRYLLFAIHRLVAAVRGDTSDPVRPDSTEALTATDAS